MDKNLEDAIRREVDAEAAKLTQLSEGRTFGPTDAGTILHAHLLLEHALRRYIEELNPKLGSLADVRLKFIQLLALYEASEYALSYLAAGMRALNRVRNAISHDMHKPIPREMLQPMMVLIRDKSNNDAPWICTLFATTACGALAMLKALAHSADETAQRAAIHAEVMRILGELEPQSTAE